MIQSKFFSILAIPALLTLASPAFAQDTECASDADCAEGSACEKASWVDGCMGGTAECDNTVHEAETGWCVVQPVSCTENSDCGEYTECQASNDGVCWASSDGNSGCEEPDPDAPKFCGPASVNCETNDECPREFECVPLDCGEIMACPEGEVCGELPTCADSRVGECVPKSIECESDDECPSEWSCLGTVGYECSGSGSGGTVDPVDPDAADPPEGDPAIAPEDCVEVPTVGYCSPDALAGSYFGTADLAGSGSPTAENTARDDAKTDSDGASSDDDSSASESGGGCSVSQHSPNSGGWVWMLLFAAPLFFRRRRDTGERA